MAEQLICNQQVDGSTPFTSSIYGSVPERPKGADCKSVVSDFGGPNPPAPTKKPSNGRFFNFCGAVDSERAGSTLFVLISPWTYAMFAGWPERDRFW